MREYVALANCPTNFLPSGICAIGDIRICCFFDNQTFSRIWRKRTSAEPVSSTLAPVAFQFFGDSWLSPSSAAGGYSVRFITRRLVQLRRPICSRLTLPHAASSDTAQTYVRKHRCAWVRLTRNSSAYLKRAPHLCIEGESGLVPGYSPSSFTGAACQNPFLMASMFRK